VPIITPTQINTTETIIILTTTANQKDISLIVILLRITVIVRAVNIINAKQAISDKPITSVFLTLFIISS